MRPLLPQNSRSQRAPYAVHLKGEVRPPRILMFAPSCYPPGNPESFVNANLVAAMLDSGWLVDVETCPDTVYQWYPPSSRMWRSVAANAHSVCELRETLVNRISCALRTALIVRQRAAGSRWAIPAVNHALKLCADRKYDFVLSRALPSEAHLAASMFARRTGTPWVANWNDPSPTCMFPAPYGEGKEGIQQLDFWARRYYSAVARDADWHTFPCERLRTYMCGYLPGDVFNRSSVIPHAAPHPSLRPDHSTGRERGFELLHAGSLRPPRDPQSFFRGLQIFHERTRPRESVRVRFIVEQPGNTLAAAKSCGVEHLVQLERGKPYEEALSLLTSADVLVILEAAMGEGIFLPSKFVDYVQSGRPILAVSPRVGTLADILSARGGGIAVDGANPESIASGIATLFESWRAGRLERRFGSASLQSLFDRNAVLRAYQELFNRISPHTTQHSRN